MPLQLNDDELMLIKRLLRQRLAELNPEIQHTGAAKLRDELRERQQRLAALYRRVQEILPGEED